MKFFLNLLTVTCVALATSSSAFAKTKKPKTTLADFNGSYTGTATLSAGGMVYSGPLSLSSKANKTGKTATLGLSGSVSNGGMTVPVSAAVNFANGSFSIDNFVFNTLAQGSYPGSASYTVGKNSITFQGLATVGGTTYPFSGNILTSTKGRTHKLTYTTTVIVSGTPYVFSFAVSERLKKPAK